MRRPLLGEVYNDPTLTEIPRAEERKKKTEHVFCGLLYFPQVFASNGYHMGMGVEYVSDTYTQFYIHESSKFSDI